MTTSEDEAKRRRLEQALDRVVHLAETGGLGERHRYMVTRFVEVEAADEEHAVLLAEMGEGVRYQAQVERLPDES